MNKVFKFKEYDISVNLVKDFIENLEGPLNEVKNYKDSSIMKILKKLQADLKFNYGFVFTFGAGIGSLLPIVNSLVKNGNISAELNKENLILLTICAISIAYLEEKKNRTGEDKFVCNSCDGKINDCDECDGKGFVKSVVKKEDVKTLLTELKLRGIGNGIVKKVSSCLVHIGKFLKAIFLNTRVAISNIIDMFGYTAIMIPTMNAISYLIDHNSWDMNTLPSIILQNLVYMGVGVTTFLVRQGFDFLSKKLNDFIKKMSGKKRDDNIKPINEQ